MALAALSGDEQCIIFGKLCNKLDPGIAVAFSSTNSELRALTQAPRQQLKADHKAAAALCLKLRMRSCKELLETTSVDWYNTGLSSDDLALLGTLGSVLPALKRLGLDEPTGDGVQRLVEKLGTGALPAVTLLNLNNSHMGDAGASALAAALGRGALPRLRTLWLYNAALGDAGLVALAPALRRLPALEDLDLSRNPFGEEGLAALVAPPPPPAGAPPKTTGGLTKLEQLYLSYTQINDASCAALADALVGGVLPALHNLSYQGVPASAAAKAAVNEAYLNRSSRRAPSL